MIWYMNYGNLEFMLIEIKPFRRKILWNEKVNIRITQCMMSISSVDLSLFVNTCHHFFREKD